MIYSFLSSIFIKKTPNKLLQYLRGLPSNCCELHRALTILLTGCESRICPGDLLVMSQVRYWLLHPAIILYYHIEIYWCLGTYMLAKPAGLSNFISLTDFDRNPYSVYFNMAHWPIPSHGTQSMLPQPPVMTMISTRYPGSIAYSATSI